MLTAATRPSNERKNSTCCKRSVWAKPPIPHMLWGIFVCRRCQPTSESLSQSPPSITQWVTTNHPPDCYNVSRLIDRRQSYDGRQRLTVRQTEVRWLRPGKPENGDGTFRLALPEGSTVRPVIRGMGVPSGKVVMTMINSRRSCAKQPLNTEQQGGIQ